MKKNLKAPFVVFLVFALVSFLLWAVCACYYIGINVFGIFNGAVSGGALDANKALTDWALWLKGAFTPDFANFTGDQLLKNIGNFVTWGINLVAFISFLVGLIAPKKKASVKLWCGLLAILLWVASVWSMIGQGLVEIFGGVTGSFIDVLKHAFVDVLYGNIYTAITDLIAGGTNVAPILYAIGDATHYLSWVALLLFMLNGLLTFIFGCVYAKRSYKNKLAAIEAEVAEEEVEELEEPVEELEEVEEPDEYVETAEEVVPTFYPEEEQPAEEQPAEEVPAEAKEEPVSEELPKEEPVSDEDVLVTEPVEEEVKEEAKEEVPAAGIDTNSLAAMLREVVRDIVRDEIARNNLNKPEDRPTSDSHADNHSIVGATFGGPLVVQYFNGGINGVTPAAPVMAAPAPVAAAPAPVAPVAAPAPKPVEAKPFIKETAPVAEPVATVEEGEKEEKNGNFERIPFATRIIAADKEMQDQYNQLKNEILAYGVKSRVATSGDTFRLHTKTYVKIAVAGKSLKLHFALDPADYSDSTMPIGDASSKAAYADTPLMFKVKSALSLRRAIGLVADTMEKDGLVKKEVGSVNWVKELKAELKAKK